MTVGEAREIALPARVAARGVDGTAAREAARAAGHAVATAHADGHAAIATNYAVKAAAAALDDAAVDDAAPSPPSASGSGGSARPASGPSWSPTAGTADGPRTDD